MSPKEVYNEIVRAFEEKYSFIGRDFAERVLLTAASWNIQKTTKSFMRLNGHLLLMYRHGFLKSTLLRRFKQIMGDELCSITNSVRAASIRGSVYSHEGSPVFIPPTVFDSPFIVCTEFGQVTGDETSGVVQELLNLLEEGETSVQLVKIASLPEEYKIELEEKYKEYELDFYKINGFRYKTNTSWIVATNNYRVIRSYALESRFDTITYSDKELTHELTKHVDRNEWHIDEDAVYKLREYVKNRKFDKTKFELPDEIYSNNISPRESASLQRFGLSRLWWGIKTKVEDLIALFKKMRISTARSRSNISDIIMKLLEIHGELSSKEIIDLSGYARSSVYSTLNNLYENGLVKRKLVEHKAFVYFLDR